MSLKKNYWSRTPLIARKIGDSLLAASIFMSTYAVLNDYKNLGIIIMIVGGVGKFISNLFSTPE